MKARKIETIVVEWSLFGNRRRREFNSSRLADATLALAPGSARSAGRQPSNGCSMQPVDDLAWWRAALAGEAPLITEEPQAGYYKRRLVKGGPFVPVEFWTVRQYDDAGDLTDDVKTMCSVDGWVVDAVDNWTYCAAQPIPKAEFDYLTKVSAYAKLNDRREPLANPRKRIDPLSFPLPDVSPKKRTTRK